MIHLSLERGLSNCLPNCNYNILSSNFEQGLQYRIRKYLPNCDIYILIHMYNHWITPGGYSSQIRGLCFMKWPSKKMLQKFVISDRVWGLSLVQSQKHAMTWYIFLKMFYRTRWYSPYDDCNVDGLFQVRFHAWCGMSRQVFHCKECCARIWHLFRPDRRDDPYQEASHTLVDFVFTTTLKILCIRPCHNVTDLLGEMAKNAVHIKTHYWIIWPIKERKCGHIIP